jgi:3-hydroxyacyl-[acyl-carrier-protein] dehydratase
MRFQLVDRVLELDPGKRIVVSKVLSRAEEYLGDHFPKRPIMPGVMMLQVCVEAGMWAVRAGGAAPYGAVLTEVRNIRYGNLFEPGNEMRAEVTVLSAEDGRWKMKAEGFVGDARVISARMVLAPVAVEVDGRPLDRVAAKVKASLDERWALLAPKSVAQ